MRPGNQKIAFGFGVALCFIVLFLFFSKDDAHSVASQKTATTSSSKSSLNESEPPAEKTASEASSQTASSPVDDHLAISEDAWVGQVVNPSFQGIAEAKVTVHTFLKTIKQKHHTTDDDGFFQLPNPERLRLTLEVSAEGYLTRRLEFPLVDMLQENKIILQPGGNLELNVVDEKNLPIAGAQIVPTIGGVFSTNQQGVAYLKKLRDPAQLIIRADGFNDLKATLPLDKAVQEITLLRNGFAHGLVFDAEDDSLLQEFSIKWSDQSSQSQSETFQNASGRFEIGDLPRHNASLIFSAPEYLTQKVRLNEILPKGRGKALEVRLEKTGIFFSGKVDSTVALEVPNARVVALIGGRMEPGTRPSVKFPQRQNGVWTIIQEPWIDQVETRTDHQGHFAIGPLPRASYISLVTLAPGHAPVITKDLETLLEDARHTIQVRLKPFGKITGSAGQETYPGNRIVSLRDDSRHQVDVILRPGEQDFQFDEVIPGEARLWLRAEAGDHLATGELAPIIPDQKTQQVVSQKSVHVELGFFDKLTLGGSILLDKQPMAHGAVIVFQKKPPTRIFRTQTNELGQFNFYPLKPGSYEIMANGTAEDEIFGERNRATIDLQTSQTDLQLEFQSMGHVFGRIVSEPTGSRVVMDIKYPVGNRTIVNSRKTTLVQAQGFFEFSQVPSGTFDLLLDTSSQTPQALIREVVMPPDGQDLDLGDLGEKAGELYITLGGPEAFQKTQVIFNQQNPPGESVSTFLLGKLTPAQGSLKVTGLSPGMLQITANAPVGFSIQPPSVEMTIEEDRENHVQFELQAQTYLQVGSMTPMDLLRIKSGRLFHEGTQRYWDIPLASNEPSPIQAASGPKVFRWNNQIIAQAIPEGWWQLHLENELGLAKRRFQLFPGTPMLFTISYTDFSRSRD